MAAPFDHIATTYDAHFTRSVIGQLQRKQVWSYLEKITPELKGLEILELNCGTGEDAILFSEKGFNIVATDVSEEMLKLTTQKANQFSMQNKITSHYLDLDSVDETAFDKKFDLIFSNFGGLNCIRSESMQKLMRKIPKLLSPQGRFVGVIMPRFCLWESMYFLFKLKLFSVFRRWTSKEVKADLQGATIKTWYYWPRQIKKWTKNDFECISIRPIGIALPPSYLENFLIKRPRLLRRLDRLEKKLNRFPILSGMADHYLIDLKLK